MAANLQAELSRLETEILRLNAQRELLLRLLGQDNPPAAPSAIVAEPTRQVARRKSSLRPTNPANTAAILEAVGKYPGRTLREIAEIVGKAQGADEKAVLSLYNTGYGLARRGKLVKDEQHRVRLPD